MRRMNRVYGAVLAIALVWGCGLALSGCGLLKGSGPQEAAFTPPEGVEVTMTAPVGVTLEERVQKARERRGDYYANRLAIFLKDTPGRAPEGIVFVGDSITERFPVDTAFPNQNAINRGIGGDMVIGVLERLDVSVVDLKPSRLFVMIGTNNILWPGEHSVESLVAEYKTLLKALKIAAPEATLTVISVPPLGRQFATKNPQVRVLNETIATLAKQEGLRYVDLFPWMTNASGELAQEYTGDGVHFTIAGYQAWLQALLPFDEFVEAAAALAPLGRNVTQTTYPTDAIDPKGASTYGGGRAADQLIVYTPAYGKPTTGTNKWGLEAIVRNGTVESVGGNDLAIPQDGFVISGHGRAASWMQTNLKPGTPVAIEKNAVKLGLAPETDTPVDQKTRMAMIRALDRMEQLKSQNAASDQTREVLKILKSLQTLRVDSTPDPAAVDAVLTRLGAID